jgi:hypothetical protein
MAYASSENAGPKPLYIQGAAIFSPFELPERFSLGSLSHKLVVIELFGGGRVTMAVGAQPKPVNWRGTFIENIDSKVAQLTSYMTSAQEISISYGSQKWYGKVTDFTFDAAYLTTNYDITLELTRSATGTLNGSSAVSPDAQNQSLAGNASNNIGLIVTQDASASTLAANAASLSTTVAQTPLATSSGTAIAALSAQAASVLTQAQAYAATIPSTDARFLPINSAVDSLTLLGANIKSAETSASVKVTGGTMFDVAAQYCGDASQAFAIMTANGIYSPILSKTNPTLIFIPQSLRSTTFKAAA